MTSISLAILSLHMLSFMDGHFCQASVGCYARFCAASPKHSAMASDSLALPKPTDIKPKSMQQKIIPKNLGFRGMWTRGPLQKYLQNKLQKCVLFGDHWKEDLINDKSCHLPGCTGTAKQKSPFQAH